MRQILLGLLVFVTLTGCDGITGLHISGSGEPIAPSSDGQSGPLRVYFTRPGGMGDPAHSLDRILAGYIEQAQQSIDVAAHELDNHIITDALVRAVERGIRVRLVSETRYLDEHGVQALKAVGVPIVDDQRDGALMHNKFMVFDHRSVWTGSMNFTENGTKHNNNHGIFIDDVRIAKNYETKFKWMFELGKFGGRPSRGARIPYPDVILNDGTKVENYFSTHDNVADEIMEELEAARRTIHFMAFSFTSDDLGKAMQRKARAGVKVRGVFEKRQSYGGYSEFNRLDSMYPDVEVYMDANRRNMHHKAIIVDSNVTIAGSYNFSKNAEENNDENIVIIHSATIGEMFEGEFQYVFGPAREARR